MTEKIVLRMRSHVKILFPPLVGFLVLIALHVLAATYWPYVTGWGWQGFDDWSLLIVHGVLLIFNVAIVVIPVLRWWAASFTLTTERAIQEWGIIMKRSRSVPLDSVVSVDVERGLLDRIFGCGSFSFQDPSSAMSTQPGAVMTRPGGRGTGVRFHDVPNWRSVQVLIDQAMRRRKSDDDDA